MGRRNKSFHKEVQKGGSYVVDFDAPTVMRKCRSATAQLDKFLEDLYEKKGSTRETALCSIIQSLSFTFQYQFAYKNFSALLYQCLKSFKKGSAKESCLAVEALGLLAITIGCGENCHELFTEAVPVLSEALNTESRPLKLKLILDCVAIITFVGGNDLEETERSMQSIWHFMHSESNLKETQSTAISAWSFLLSTMDSWSISYKYWRGAIPFFKNLLEADDKSILTVASQALALILELGCLEKFDGDSSTMDEINIKKILKDGCALNTSVKIGRQKLEVNTLPQQLQLSFLKRVLGSGFNEHMRENELLHDVFNFKPEKRKLGNEVYVVERDEVAINLFVPDVRRENSFQRMHKSPNSVFNKARTQIRNKNRDIRGEELRSLED